MGAITRAAANNFTTSGVILPAAINDASVASLTELENAAAGGAMTLISEQTVGSSASSVDFTSGIDSTYPIYKIEVINLHCSDNNTKPSINFRDGGSSFDAVKTTTHFYAYNNEANTQNLFSYDTGGDLAQSTSDQAMFFQNMSNENDSSGSGNIFLFNPSNTTFVKHFLIDFHVVGNPVASARGLTAGYCNTTSAIDGVTFLMNSGTIDAGTFKLYGISGS